MYCNTFNIYYVLIYSYNYFNPFKYQSITYVIKKISLELNYNYSLLVCEQYKFKNIQTYNLYHQKIDKDDWERINVIKQLLNYTLQVVGFMYHFISSSNIRLIVINILLFIIKSEEMYTAISSEN